MLKRIAFCLLASLVQAATGKCDCYIDDLPSPTAMDCNTFLNTTVTNLPAHFTVGESGACDAALVQRLDTYPASYDVTISGLLYLIDIKQLPMFGVFKSDWNLKQDDPIEQTFDWEMDERIPTDNRLDIAIAAHEQVCSISFDITSSGADQCSEQSTTIIPQGSTSDTCCEQCLKDTECKYYHLKHNPNYESVCELFNTCNPSPGRRLDEEDSALTFVHRGSKKLISPPSLPPSPPPPPFNWTLLIVLVVVGVVLVTVLLLWCRRYVEVSVEAAA